jgi:hypothetical protein
VRLPRQRQAGQELPATRRYKQHQVSANIAADQRSKKIKLDDLLTVDLYADSISMLLNPSRNQFRIPRLDVDEIPLSVVPRSIVLPRKLRRLRDHVHACTIACDSHHVRVDSTCKCELIQRHNS